MTIVETHTTHREVELLDTLRSFGGSARTANLAETMQVSEETVRRTVKALAQAGLVQRVHGGVYLSNTEALAPVNTRLSKRSEEKARIAKATAALIPNGSSLFLDVGSTTAYVAEALKQHRDLTIVTNALHPAQTLVNVNGNRVFLAGGELGVVENGAFGPETLAYVARFNIDTAVISIDGFDAASGFLLAGSAEADLARAVTTRARRSIVVSDATKFGQSAPMVACSPENVDMVITDQPLRSSFTKKLAAWDIEVTVAKEGGA